MKQRIFNYSSKYIAHELKRNNRGGSFIVNKKFSLEEKIDYYSSRINDNKLTDSQRKYAKIKVGMLISGIVESF